MANEVQKAVRMPGEAVERAERLVRVLAKLPSYSPWRLTTSSVLRLAILRGLDALEAEAQARKR